MCSNVTEIITGNAGARGSWSGERARWGRQVRRTRTGRFTSAGIPLTTPITGNHYRDDVGSVSGITNDVFFGNVPGNWVVTSEKERGAWTEVSTRG